MYRAFLPDFFGSPVPEESLATCRKCVVAHPARVPPAPGVLTPETKCCSFHPTQPNYLVGAVLSATAKRSTEGKSRVRRMIARRVGITPCGITPPKKYILLCQHGGDDVGRSKSLACPFYRMSSGECTIWGFAEATCSTTFCVHVAGRDGGRFWRAARDYLRYVESVLARCAAHNLGCGAPAVLAGELSVASPVELLSPEELDDMPPEPGTYKEVWGKWEGKEEAFYRKAYEFVESLSRTTYLQMAGGLQEVHLAHLRSAYAAMMSPEIPKRMMRNPRLSAVRRTDGRYVVYSDLGVYEITEILYRAIEYFDGRRTTRAARKMIRDEMAVELEEDVLVSLYRQEVLVPSSATGRP